MRLRLGEEGCFQDVQADEQAQSQQDHAGQERQPPAPAQELVFGERGDRREGAVGQQEPGGHARLGGTGVETAAAVVAVLHHEDHGAAPFAPHAQPLDEAQDSQRDRRQHADLVIGRQQPDQEGGEPHHHERGHEHRFAADLVAVMAEDDSAERPGEEADGIGGQGRHRARERIERGEE